MRAEDVGGRDGHAAAPALALRTSLTTRQLRLLPAARAAPPRLRGSVDLRLLPEISERLKKLVLLGYGIVVDGVIVCLIFLMLIVLVLSFASVVVATFHMVPVLRPSSFEEQDFRLLVENVLDVFIVIELFGTFTEYVRSRHVRISGLLDVTIVFTLREMLVKLYAQRFAVDELIGLCLIALVLVIARSISGRFPPR